MQYSYLPVSETHTIPNTPKIDLSNYVRTSDLEAILEGRDQKFLEVLALRYRQFHEVTSEKIVSSKRN